jgi:16S rRNA (cytidine1402-2'-O)-methyltransferase
MSARRESATGAPAGKLFLVPVPIGELGDLSPRAREVLEHVDLVACEDTRKTRRLFAALGLRASTLISYHDHNERERTPTLLERLREGRDVALVAEAGTPLVSDPGFRLVTAAIQAGVQVVSLPGPTALVTALVASGLPTHAFLFAGFLPRSSGERSAALERWKTADVTLVFYEAPHRLSASLRDLERVLGAARRAVLACNLTKKDEAFHRGTLGELRAWAQAQPAITGEVTLLVAPAEAAPTEVPEAARRVAVRLLAEGMAPRQVRDLIAEAFDLPRRAAYDLVLAGRRSKETR